MCKLPRRLKGAWSALQQAQVTREAEEEGISDDLLNLRGRKVARRLAGWAWDKFWD